MQAAESYRLWPEGPGFESRSPSIARARVRLAINTLPQTPHRAGALCTGYTLLGILQNEIQIRPYFFDNSILKEVTPQTLKVALISKQNMQVSLFNVNALVQNRRYGYKLFMRCGNKHNGKFNKQIIILMSSRKQQAFWRLHRGNMNMLLVLGGKLNEPWVRLSYSCRCPLLSCATSLYYWSSCHFLLH